MKLNKILIVILALVCSMGAFAKNNPNLPLSDGRVHLDPQPFQVANQVTLNANNVSAYIWKTGVFNQDNAHNNNPGMEWIRGTGKFCWFTSGLSIGCYINGELRLATASYKGEYLPGYCEAGVFKTDSRFQLYRISPAFPNGNSDPSNVFDTWADYAQMIPFGAPYVDVNENGVYDPGTDVPGIKDADQTIFVCLSDANPNSHSNSEGFSGGTAPIKAEVHLTAWGYSTPGLEDLYFVSWAVINKNTVPWNKTYFGVVNDPDLGDANDDYIGCDLDTTGGGKPHYLGYVWNSDDQDGDGNGFSYGQDPPAAGQDFFLSPIRPTGNQNDTVVIYNPPGSKNRMVKHGYKEIGLSSFAYFTNTSTPGPACEKDPSLPIEAYNYLSGFKKDGTPWLDASHTPPSITKYCYPGDPETGTGWTENTGKVDNCGGQNTGTVVASSPGDRRFIFNSGADDFVVNPGDTQYIVLGQLVAKGSNNKNSVTKLKTLDVTAQTVFDLNFQVIPPPPQPKVKISTRPISDIGTCAITLSWGDTSETYHFIDNIFHHGTYNFQGYEVYEVKKTATNLPDLLNPATINDDIKLIAIYDLKDSVGIITDSLPTGISINGIPQRQSFPVVPPYKSAIPSTFPDKGLNRSITLTQTNYPSLNGGLSNFVYGNTYKFIVVAYGHNPTSLPGGRVIRNSLSAALLTYTPEMPPAGTTFTFKNGDTLNTNRRDLGVIPVIMDQNQVQDALYRIQFGNADTTYSIFKSVNNGQTFNFVKGGMKTVGYHSVSQDSSKIVDGVLFQVNRMRYKFNAPFDYVGNAGVIPDFTLSADSLQTRRGGWDYNGGTRNVEASKRTPFSKPWQNLSMGLSWPNGLTYSGLTSAIPPEGTRIIKIKFTGDGNGQTAFRYAGSDAGFPYLDQKPVPFKVYEIQTDDGTATERQVNIGFLEYPDSVGGKMDGKFLPTADTSGGRDLLFIFNSSYDPSSAYYPSIDMLADQMTVDLMYVWGPKLISAQSPFYTVGDELIVYPYTQTTPEISPGNPLYYDVRTVAPVVGNSSIASQNSDLERITVVPNPYYGFNNLESNTSGRFVTFRRLPVNCTIKIYTLNGDLIKSISKNDQTSTIRWSLTNSENVPIASGIYIALIDAPGIGDKVVKIAVFTPQERIDF